MAGIAANKALLADVDRRLAEGAEAGGQKQAVRTVSFGPEATGQSETWAYEAEELDSQGTVARLPGVLAVHELLGTGEFSHVYCCTVEDNQAVGGGQQQPPSGQAKAGRPRQPKLNFSVKSRMMAVKLLRNASLEASREAQLLVELQHPQLVSMYRIVEGPPHAIYVELCTGGTLQQLVHDSETSWWASLGLRQRMRPGLDVAQAVEYLHGKGVVHRDVKTGNCFLAAPVEMASAACAPCVKLGELALARPAGALMTRGIGTVHCMAPEVITSDKYGLPADIFSCAILLHELASGQAPYSQGRKRSDGVLAVSIVQGCRPALDALPQEASSEEVRSLLEEAWASEPSERMPAAELVARLQGLQGCGN